MRLATITTDTGAAIGVLTDTGVVEISGIRGIPRTLRQMLQAGPGALDSARTAVRDAPGGVAILERDVEFLPPIPDPPRIFCVGRNYREHAAEGGAEVPEYPMIFLKPATSLVGHNRSIEVPASTSSVDWEGEIAIVIGTGGRDIPEEYALEHVAGLTVSNDVTARDWQRRTSQFDSGKMFDTFGPLGPYLVTLDEIPDVNDLQVETRVNGELMQSGNSGEMVFPIPMLVSYLSQAVQLLPGDVVMTGTPSGVGYARRPPVFLAPGDVVEVVVSGVGRLRNDVVAMATSVGR